MRNIVNHYQSCQTTSSEQLYNQVELSSCPFIVIIHQSVSKKCCCLLFSLSKRNLLRSGSSYDLSHSENLIYRLSIFTQMIRIKVMSKSVTMLSCYLRCSNVESMTLKVNALSNFSKERSKELKFGGACNKVRANFLLQFQICN